MTLINLRLNFQNPYDVVPEKDATKKIQGPHRMDRQTERWTNGRTELKHNTPTFFKAGYKNNIRPNTLHKFSVYMVFQEILYNILDDFPCYSIIYILMQQHL